ncbi:carbonic anhydrase [Mycena vitilis]|nr:carbonic anhydrase [Mycena vitilis]
MNSGLHGSSHQVRLTLPGAEVNWVQSPYDQLGLKIGEAITIRNGGGSTKEALRSIMVAQYSLGVDGEIAVFHHKDCGMSKVNTEEMRDLVKKANPGRDDIAAIVDGLQFHHITNIEGSVKIDVKFLAQNPLVIKGTKISGWVYDVDTGKVSVHQKISDIY